MSCYVSKKFVILPLTPDQNSIEVYANSEGEVFFGEDSLGTHFFFTLSQDDWEQLKDFVDNQLKDLHT